MIEAVQSKAWIDRPDFDQGAWRSRVPVRAMSLADPAAPTLSGLLKFIELKGRAACRAAPAGVTRREPPIGAARSKNVLAMLKVNRLPRKIRDEP